MREATIRDFLRKRRQVHQKAVREEIKRLTTRAAEIGAQRVILFGSLTRQEAGLTSDLDLLIVWDTPLNFLERTAELYRRLQPRIGADLLAYTPAEMQRMGHNPFVRRALQEGKVLYEA
ncbi:MAG: nucleotidyltransferase domain-containing protein [candidate division Zixibacteria bacterium]|nr:nucleotidyltransferase domain-containing protein [candidate division Zixibacteria bacterium]